MSAAAERLEALLALMRRLRDPEQGCEWDRAQDFTSIAPYTIEEAYEVADAIARADRDALRDELGDLLFQVVFHARLAEERGWFDFAAVAAGIHDKLVRRHPHVFAPERQVAGESLGQSWERHKAAERADRGQQGALDGVPVGLPALTRAAKLGRRAARVGFDWPDVVGVRAKIEEELAELAAAHADPALHDTLSEELGDVLFSLTNLARHLKLDPEQALRSANDKFLRRFAHMEAAVGDGRALQALSAAEWEQLWQQAKRAERDG
ncbi:MAG: nucleoside triphosphate pyrophosphohydrolase [Steroidobacteraceae bacterium]